MSGWVGRLVSLRRLGWRKALLVRIDAAETDPEGAMWFWGRYA